MISRRRFLTGLGAGATAAVAVGYGMSQGLGGGDDPSAPSASSASSVRGRRAARTLGGRDDRTLVVVELGGGNDGLNTVVPMTDPAYHALRPTLGVTDAIALDGEVGFHPKLAKLAARYAAGHVAIVEGVGVPDPDLSHFASVASWWSATPGVGSGTGWLGRYLDGTVGGDDTPAALAALTIGPVPSPALLGTRSSSASIADATGLQPALPGWVGAAADPDALVAAWRRLVPASPDPKSRIGEVQRAITHTVAARSELDVDLRGVASGADAFALAAQLVVSDAPPRVVYLNELGDFDTHQGQAQRQPTLLGDLDTGLDAFFAAVEAAGRSDRVLVMTVSEFGRRPAENGSGTDHGTAAPHLFVGAGVKGGRYGAPPSLTALDPHGNLVATTDFRSLYATVLGGWFDVDPDAVLGRAAGFGPLPVLV